MKITQSITKGDSQKLNNTKKTYIIWGTFASYLNLALALLNQ